MPKPKQGETKDEFISRCMGYEDMQKYDQDQRAAICYSYWEEKNESTNISEIDIFIQRNKDRMDYDTLIGVLADKFNLDYEEARKKVMRREESKRIKEYDDFEVDPDNDAFIVDKPFRGYDVSASGEFIGNFDDLDDVEDALKIWMKKNRWYPTIWFVDDHGGIDLYTLEESNKKISEKKDAIDIGYGQLVGIGRDTNGNKVAKFKTNTGKSFSIQTSSNLPSLHKETDVKDVDKDKVEKEVLAYVKKHGTKSQKEILPENTLNKHKGIKENYEELYKRGVEYLGVALSRESFKNLLDRKTLKELEGLLKKPSWSDEEIKLAWTYITEAYERGIYTTTVAGNEYVIRLISRAQDYLNSYWNIAPARESNSIKLSKTITLEATLKIGNVILEKGDKIKILENKSNLKEEMFKGDNGYRFNDEIAAKEIELYLESDGDLYRQQFMPIIENIKRKMKSGRYDHSLAPKLWMYYVDNGVKKYIKEFGSPGDRIDSILIKKDRMTLSQKLADYYYDQIIDGEYGDI